jgi:hypothetical protein
METAVYPLVTFSVEFDDRTAFEVEEKGFFDHAVVTLADGSRYSLHFYDPTRLGQELETEQQHGGVCVAEPGLVVIPRVTKCNMEKAVKQLAKNGYFLSLTPLASSAG